MKKANLQKSDNELARIAVEGDRVGFDEIVRRYTRPLLEYAAGRTAMIQDAEDIVQETFLRMYSSLDSFDPKYSLKNWLFTITYRLIVSQYRRKKPQQLTEQQADAIPQCSQKTDDRHWLWEMAGQMGTEAFTVLWLRYRQELSITEIAKVMNKSTINVRVLLHRSRKKLARRIAETSGSESQVQTSAMSEVCLERSKS